MKAMAWFFLVFTQGTGAPISTPSYGVIGPFPTEQACVERSKELTGVGLTKAQRVEEARRDAEHRRHYRFFWSVPEGLIGRYWAHDKARLARGVAPDSTEADERFHPEVSSEPRYLVGATISQGPWHTLLLHCWRGDQPERTH